MCGVVGVVQRGPVERKFLEKCCRLIRHRGPDHTGIHVDGGVGLGTTRLAIQDIAGGNQPMLTGDGDVVIVFNGEIYNFPDLRRELADRHDFRSRSDTEVILAGYVAWGEAVFERLSGIFAIAIWDRRRRRLLLARDPMGVKPLYFAADRQRFVFASELKVFTGMGIRNRLSHAALWQYLSSCYVFHPFSAIDGVEQVEPGELLRVDEDGRVERSRFWSMPAARFDEGPSHAEWIRRLDEAMIGAVNRQLISDVPVGLLLSSGIDSMYVLSVMKRAGRLDNLDTYTVHFEEESFSEYPPVRRVTQGLGVTNHALLLRPCDILNDFESICMTFDNLEFMPNCVAAHAVARLARTHNKVVLSGVGGDELFYGYPTYRATQIRRRLGALGPALSPLRHLAARLPHNDEYLSLREKAERFLNVVGMPPDLAHLRWRQIFSREELAALVRGAGALPTVAETMAPQLRYFDEADGKGYRGMDRASYADLRAWLVDQGLSMWDKAGMAASVEIRVPLLDLEVLALVLSVPPRLRGREFGHKRLFREVAEGSVTPEILHLPKHGFQLPVARWLRGPLRDTFRDYTANLPDELFSRAAVERMWRQFIDGKQDHSLRLWSLATLSVWSQVHRVSWG